MIAAISLMRRQPGITLAQFHRHWLDPHGVMTAELPGVHAYMQHHPIKAPGTNALARDLGIEGVPELWFDDYEQRPLAVGCVAEATFASEAALAEASGLLAGRDNDAERTAIYRVEDHRFV